MTGQLIAALSLLVLPAILPSVALLRPRPTTVFMTPLVGSVLAAVAAELEIVLGSSLLTWYIVVVVVVNALALVRLSHVDAPRRVAAQGDDTALPERSLGRRSLRRALPTWWSCITVGVMALAVVWPLQALRSPIVAYDGYAIWTLHSLFIYGGHAVFRADLTNPVYRFSNPNYPPLVSASGALGFVANGRVNLRIAVILTSLLNASALASLGCAITAVAGRHGRTVMRITALVAGASICLIGFGLSGVYGIGGYADLLWSASAAVAVVMGLVLRRSGPNLLAAWLCATVAGLSKNEGFVTAVLVFVLLAIRYVPTPRRTAPEPSTRSERTSRGSAWPVWMLRVAVLVLAMSIPSLSWALYAKFEGIGSDFVGRSTQALSFRFHTTATTVSDNLHIVPLAFAVAIVGACVLTGSRRTLSVGNDIWVWLTVAGSLAALAVTYVFGAPEIHWWLSTSANRTTIFENLALYCDMAIWLVIALSTRVAEWTHGTPAGPAQADRGTKLPDHPEPERGRPL